jgi:hypothetical protein
MLYCPYVQLIFDWYYDDSSKMEMYLDYTTLTEEYLSEKYPMVELKRMS